MSRRPAWSLYLSLLSALVPAFASALFLPPWGVALACLGCAWVWLGFLVRRLRSFESLARRLARRDLEARVEDPGDDELGRLAEGLNHMAESLLEARERVRALDTQRWQLLADITHELATPLTSIRGYTETLQDPDVPISETEQGEFLVNIQEEARRMELLIEDLFEMVRLESGKIRLRTELLDWSALCRHTLERFQPKFSKVGLRLIDDGILGPAWVEADGRRMEQVLENLLTNAVRYVPGGCTVWVSLTEVPLTEAPSFFELRVQDDGPGFPASDLEMVFDRFYRGNLTESFPGSGLGLAIVKEIVERHEGSVSASNREPTGAALAVRLPKSEA